MSADTDKLIARDALVNAAATMRGLQAEVERHTDLSPEIEGCERGIEAVAALASALEAAEAERDAAVSEIEAAEAMIDEWTEGGIQTNDLAVDVRLVLESWEAAGARAEAAETQRDRFAYALEEIESFPISRYHAGEAQRIARDVLAEVTPPEAQEA